jgi:hypothetical protein
MTIKKFIDLFKSPENADFYVVSTDINCDSNKALKLTPSVLKSFIGQIEISKKSIHYRHDVGGFVIPVNIPESVFISCGELTNGDWEDMYYYI